MGKVNLGEVGYLHVQGGKKNTVKRAVVQGSMLVKVFEQQGLRPPFPIQVGAWYEVTPTRIREVDAPTL